MAKRPRLSTHLRLADPTAPEAPHPETAAAPSRPDAEESVRTAPPQRPPESLLTILSDAGAEMTHLGWLGWSKGWEAHLRLTRYWLGLERKG